MKKVKELENKKLAQINGGTAKPVAKRGDYKGNALECIFSLFKKC